MTKKVIAFDLDDTLAITKSPISERMSDLLGELLEKYDVCVISGGKFEQFMLQVIDRLNVPEALFDRLHLMPTCGTRYFRYDQESKEWVLQYADNLTDEEKARIYEALEKGARQVGLWEENPHGELIEDRGTQVTLAALGQEAPAELKYEWAKTNAEKRLELRDAVAALIPEFEVRTAGTTSTDVTKKGIDKAFGMQELIKAMGISKQEILFLGDKLAEGGNDYPVKAMGIDTIAVDRWEDTAYVLEGILAVTD